MNLVGLKLTNKDRENIMNAIYHYSHTNAGELERVQTIYNAGQVAFLNSKKVLKALDWAGHVYEFSARKKSDELHNLIFRIKEHCGNQK